MTSGHHQNRIFFCPLVKIVSFFWENALRSANFPPSLKEGKKEKNRRGKKKKRRKKFDELRFIGAYNDFIALWPTRSGATFGNGESTIDGYLVRCRKIPISLYFNRVSHTFDSFLFQEAIFMLVGAVLFLALGIVSLVHYDVRTFPISTV